MIYSVFGKVVHIEINLAVIECHGVGYSCRTTASTLSGLKIGDEVKLFTYLNVREDLVELFGFSNAAELNAFKLLVSVSGVGPKAALSILSDLSPQGFALSVVSGDSKLLTKSQGIGPKIAQRIVLELKDKIDKQRDLKIGDLDFTGSNSSASAITGNKAEAASALIVLGFNSSEAAKALQGLDDNMATQELIKIALKKISSKS